MRSFPMTQYMRPNGRQNPGQMSLEEFSDGIEPLIAELLEEGYVFESEVMITGMAAFYCRELADVENQVGITLAPSGTADVILAVTELILSAHDQVFHSLKCPTCNTRMIEHDGDPEHGVAYYCSSCEIWWPEHDIDR